MGEVDLLRDVIHIRRRHTPGSDVAVHLALGRNQQGIDVAKGGIWGMVGESQA